MTAADCYPETYSSPHPLITGHAQVHVGNTTHDVDLDHGECTCAQGRPWRWSNKRWVPNEWCSHKMRVLASLVERSPEGDRASLQAVYNRLLGERYIVWESVSAFHKELRRGDEAMAQYWALSVAAHRGLHGLVRYMMNILFEECRDLDLYAHLMRLGEQGRSVSYRDAMNAVRWFCRARKKWQLEGRLRIFINEMSGYRSLANDYGYAVARGKDIIEPGAFEKLRTCLIDGLHSTDPVKFQTGLKGMFKSQHPKGHEYLKVTIFNLLSDALNGEGPFADKPNRFVFNHEYARRVHALVYRRYATFGDIGYHDLNALGDALTGEHYADGCHILPKPKQRLLLGSPSLYAPPLGKLLPIPLYALDNHNHQGKHLMARWGAYELQPGAEQEHLDFRWCGAYMGVAWRYLAYDQHDTCEVAWRLVRWTPNWLWGHLNSMWY